MPATMMHIQSVGCLDRVAHKHRLCCRFSTEPIPRFYLRRGCGKCLFLYSDEKDCPTRRHKKYSIVYRLRPCQHKQHWDRMAQWQLPLQSLIYKYCRKRIPICYLRQSFSKHLHLLLRNNTLMACLLHRQRQESGRHEMARYCAT